jgi:hypothetical protein
VQYSEQAVNRIRSEMVGGQSRERESKKSLLPCMHACSKTLETAERERENTEHCFAWSPCTQQDAHVRIASGFQLGFDRVFQSVRRSKG